MHRGTPQRSKRSQGPKKEKGTKPAPIPKDPTRKGLYHRCLNSIRSQLLECGAAAWGIKECTWVALRAAEEGRATATKKDYCNPISLGYQCPNGPCIVWAKLAKHRISNDGLGAFLHEQQGGVKTAAPRAPSPPPRKKGRYEMLSQDEGFDSDQEEEHGDEERGEEDEESDNSGNQPSRGANYTDADSIRSIHRQIDAAANDPAQMASRETVEEAMASIDADVEASEARAKKERKKARKQAKKASQRKLKGAKSQFRAPRRTHPPVTHERVKQIGGDTTAPGQAVSAAASLPRSKKAGKQPMQG